jgi:hypothetical protein
VLKNARSNHIWVNAFTLVKPTEQTYANIGRAVVQMMQDKSNLLPSYYGHSEGDVSELQRLTPTLYMSINAS